MAMALATLSTIFGWIYFGFWALAFYGQLYTNWRLKSVVGYSLNFQLLSMTAFTFYSYVNIMGYFFQDTNPYNDYGLGAVRIQDLYFSLHSLLLTCLIGIQCLIYPREPNRLSNATFGITVIAWVIAIIFLIIYEATSWIPTDQDSNLYTVLGGLTLILTAFKYVPAAHWNFQRKSTVGWSSIYIVCEFLGAFFSLIQSVIDVSYGVSQFINPFKFSLGNIAIIFDVLFMIQRFLLFRDAHKKRIIIYESGDQYKRLQEKTRNQVENDLYGSRISVM